MSQMYPDEETQNLVDEWIREHAYDPCHWVLGSTPLDEFQVADLVTLLDIVRPLWRGGALAGHERKAGT